MLANCGGTHFDGQVYEADSLAFRLNGVPTHWRRIQVDGTLLAFRDDSAQATIMVNGRCGKDGDDVPLESLTHHLFLHFTDRSITKQERLDLDGRAALHTSLTAELDGVEKRYSVYVLKKNGCVYDFVQVSDPAAPEASENGFGRFVRGFSTIRP